MRAIFAVAAIALFVPVPAGAQIDSLDVVPLQELPGQSVAPAAVAQATDVEVVDNAFEPREITVQPGTSVTWTQTGDNPHSVTADDGSFDSHPNCPPVCMSNGDTFEHSFDEAGNYPYYCRIHGDEGGAGMSGVVVVQAAAQQNASPAPQGTPPPAAPAAPAATAGTGAQPERDPLPLTGGPGAGPLAGSAMLAAAVLLRRIAGRPAREGDAGT